MEDAHHLLPTLCDVRDRVVNIELKLDELRTRPRFEGHPDQRYGHITYSQHGEDLLFACMFDLLKITKPTFLDIGAHHPLNCNNTALLYSRGSRGVNVDANPDVMPEFHRLRSEDLNLNLAIGPSAGTMLLYRIDALSGRNTLSRFAAEEFIRNHPNFKITDTLEVEVMTLERLVDDHCDGVFPDLLSIDAEGLDYTILESTNFQTDLPRVLCIECTSSAGHVGQDIIDLARSKTFVPYVRMGENMIFLSPQAADRISSLSSP